MIERHHLSPFEQLRIGFAVGITYIAVRHMRGFSMKYESVTPYSAQGFWGGKQIFLDARISIDRVRF